MAEIDWRYWAALLGTAIWVGMRDAEKEPIIRRCAKTAASGLLAAGAAVNLRRICGGLKLRRPF